MKIIKAAYCDGVVKIVDCSSGAVIAQSDGFFLMKFRKYRKYS